MLRGVGTLDWVRPVGTAECWLIFRLVKHPPEGLEAKIQDSRESVEA